VDRVLRRVVGLHRGEGAETDVECHPGVTHIRSREPGEEFRREVEAGGRRGDGPVGGGEHGLVAGAVGVGGAALADVRRQRDVSALCQQLGRGAGAVGFHEPVPVGGAAAEGQPQRAGVEGERLAGLGVAAGLRQQLPQPVGCLADEQAFPLAAGGLAPADHAGRDDAGVVEDEEVAGREEVRQLAEDAVLEFAGGAADDEEPGVVAPRRGVLGDEPVGKGIVEEHERRAGGVSPRIPARASARGW
jgi:hypothetical protein